MGATRGELGTTALVALLSLASILGMLGSCEIGPIGGTAELLTYTGVLALIDFV